MDGRKITTGGNNDIEQQSKHVQQEKEKWARQQDNKANLKFN